MRVLKIDDLPEKPMGTATAIDGWTGGAVKRTRQELIADGQSDNFRCNVVNFSAGATTGWHAHDSDQILVVTTGRGVKTCSVAPSGGALIDLSRDGR
jgi:quercetin dioxygenase-like cupin family protein